MKAALKGCPSRRLNDKSSAQKPERISKQKAAAFSNQGGGCHGWQQSAGDGDTHQPG